MGSVRMLTDLNGVCLANRIRLDSILDARLSRMWPAVFALQGMWRSNTAGMWGMMRLMFMVMCVYMVYTKIRKIA